MGAAVGFLSGMFGVGGGFLMTPLLIFSGIPPAVAVGTEAAQIVASSVVRRAGALAAQQRRHQDGHRAADRAAWSASIAGVQLVKLLRRLGQFDLFVTVCYVTFLGVIGTLMLIESARRHAPRARRRPDVGPTLRPAQLDPRAAVQDALSPLQALYQRHPSLAIGGASVCWRRSWASAEASSWCRP